MNEKIQNEIAIPTPDELPGAEEMKPDQPTAPTEAKFYLVPNRKDRRRAASKARKARKTRNKTKR
ncbi:MAG: hypothetical protein C0396_08280 [Anaerolinea sp.]|nr:hypothetical protein [Anaerolinea sp.]